MSGKFVQLTEQLQEYVVAQCSNGLDPLLAELRRETEALGGISEMAISLDQAELIGLLVSLIGAKHAIEIGTFTGTSSIAIARQLQPGGKLTCFDQSLPYTGIARRYWQKA